MPLRVDAGDLQPGERVWFFISTYQYLIDTYELFAASALVSATFCCYIAAGAMVIMSIRMYSNLGVHWSLALLGCISALMTPVPFVFYKYGYRIRQWNKKEPEK